MAELVVLDIGTHKAEELRVLIGDRLFLINAYSKWWFDWFKRQVKKLIGHRGHVSYNGGTYIASPFSRSLGEHGRYVRQILLPKNYLKNYKVIAIDPVVSVTSKYIDALRKKVVVSYIPVAILPHDADGHCRMKCFFINRNSLSSSLCSADENIKDVVMCPAFRFREILEGLQLFEFIKPNTKLLMRMNCEGSELAVIKELVESKVAINNLLGEYC